MSLEIALAENTKAMQTLTEALKASDVLRKEVLEKAEAEARRATGKATKPAEKAAEKLAETTQQISTNPEAREEPKETEKPADLAPEVTAAQEAVATFVSAATTPEDREKRKTDVRGLLDKLGVKRTQELDATGAGRLSKAIATLTERYAPKPADDDLL